VKLLSPVEMVSFFTQDVEDFLDYNPIVVRVILLSIISTTLG